MIGRRACAALAVASAGLHLLMLGHTPNPVAAALLVAMVIACLYCARELWRDGTERAWVVVALMNLAMIALHLPAPAHHHGVSVTAAAPSPPTVMAVATLVALVEVPAAPPRGGCASGRPAEPNGPPQRYTRPLRRRASARRTDGTRPTRLIAALRSGRAARGSVASRVSRSVISTTSFAIGRRVAL